jgi:hypothetical protein
MLMADPAEIIISSVLVVDMANQSMCISISLWYDGRRKVGTKALIDCRAQGMFIDRTFTERNGIPLALLKKLIQAKNVDGTLNKRGVITHFTRSHITVHGSKFQVWLLAIGLGNDHVILGLPWLREINPLVNWKEGTLCFNDEQRIRWLFASPSQGDKKTTHTLLVEATNEGEETTRTLLSPEKETMTLLNQGEETTSPLLSLAEETTTLRTLYKELCIFIERRACHMPS